MLQLLECCVSGVTRMKKYWKDKGIVHLQTPDGISHSETVKESESPNIIFLGKENPKQNVFNCEKQIEMIKKDICMMRDILPKYYQDNITSIHGQNFV